MSVVAEPHANAGAPVGVIDIGSNSVRLVVFEGCRRSPLVQYNEKAICALGRDISRTGRLDQSAVEETLALLRRFRILAEHMGVGSMHAVATAAVREASNGSEFVQAAEQAIAGRIAILPGMEEARLAATGVLSGMPGADGVVGDLGGGSLELVDVTEGRAGHGETAPIGTLRLLERAPRPKNAIVIVNDVLATMELPARVRNRTLYLVGGTWRAIARIDMEQRKYPLHIIDHYTLQPNEALQIARVVRGLSGASLRLMPSVSGARVATIAHGALVLERLIAVGEPSEIVFSAYGLREGIFHSTLNAAIASEDPLLAGARAIAERNARSVEHGFELADWTHPLFASDTHPETPTEQRLREAACLLGDISWRAHPDYRGRRSIDTVIYGNLADVDHAGRAFLALASHCCHANRIRDPAAVVLVKLVDERAVKRARILGSAIRLAYSLTGALEGTLQRILLGRSGDEIVVTLPADLADLNGGALNRRLFNLANLMGCEGRVEIAG